MGKVLTGEKYRDVLRLTNFSNIPATVALTQNVPVFIGSMKIPAGQALELGYDVFSSLDTAVGRAFIDMKDNSGTPVALNGKVRLSIWDEEDRPIVIIGQWDAETLRQTTLTQRVPLPAQGQLLTEDKKLAIEFTCYDTGKTFSLANSNMLVDCTKYKVSNQ